MPDFDATDLKTAVQELNQRLNKDPEADTRSLLSKALDLIGSLVGKKTEGTSDAKTVSDDDKTLAKSDDLHVHVGGGKALTEDEDMAEDTNIASEIAELLADHLGHHTEKSLDLAKGVRGQSSLVNVNSFLTKSLTQQASLVTRVETLSKAVATLQSENTSLRELAQAQMVASEAMLKGLTTLLDGRDDPPAEMRSKYDQLSKAVVDRLGPNGGQAVQYNKSMAAQMRLAGKITEGQQRFWKQFNRLPDGVQLSS